MMLYQYRGVLNADGLRYLGDLLSSGKLMFSPPSSFNDPFDCYPRNADAARCGLPHAVVDQMNHTQQRAIGVLLGVACFTPDPVHHLMWGHYGDHHRSVCVGFDSEVLRDLVPKNDRGHALYEGPREVRYAEERPDEDDPDRVLIKSPAWEYESEHRLFASKKPGTPAGGPGVGTVPREAIREVVLGARMRPEVQARVQELSSAHVPQAVMKKVVIHSGTYELVLENQADQPNMPPTHGFVHGPDDEWTPIGG